MKYLIFINTYETDIWKIVNYISKGERDNKYKYESLETLASWKCIAIKTNNINAIKRHLTKHIKNNLVTRIMKIDDENR